MTLLEAIQNCGDNWFRPRIFKGQGIACSVYEGCVYSEQQSGPSLGFWNIYRASDFIGDWEIVTPEQVMGERK